uniref:Uncharacterized protein n=1 Tax=Molossus molossus TaxID=27622 RepID=A0A7J8GKQ1_MOLMO|nr:hypothetical protein HJG59_011422 [Molossus molossus]
MEIITFLSHRPSAGSIVPLSRTMLSGMTTQGIKPPGSKEMKWREPLVGFPLLGKYVVLSDWCWGFLGYAPRTGTAGSSGRSTFYFLRKYQPERLRAPLCSFIAPLFTIVKIWKQPKCPSVDEWIKKPWYMYTMEYYAAVKNNNKDLLPFETAWRDLKSIMLNEISQ